MMALVVVALGDHLKEGLAYVWEPDALGRRKMIVYDVNLERQKDFGSGPEVRFSKDPQKE